MENTVGKWREKERLHGDDGWRTGLWGECNFDRQRVAEAQCRSPGGWSIVMKPSVLHAYTKRCFGPQHLLSSASLTLADIWVPTCWAWGHDSCHQGAHDSCLRPDYEQTISIQTSKTSAKVIESSFSRYAKSSPSYLLLPSFHKRAFEHCTIRRM